MKHDFDRPRRKAVALDPHPLCHTALLTLLARFNIELVGAATSARTAQTLLQEHTPDLLVMEIESDRGSRSRARADLRRPRRDAGADGDRPVGHERLCADRRGVRSRRVRVRPQTSDPEAIATAIRRRSSRLLYLARPQEHPEPAKQNDVLHKLTRRELEILQPVSGGRSNREVAEILWVADQTVKFHLANSTASSESATGSRRLLGPRERHPRRCGRGRARPADGGGEQERRYHAALVPLRSPRSKRLRGDRGNIAMTLNEYCRVRAPRH